ncbi:MAG: hypothetical protein U0821_27015 [Chloroflexota bacterium]
MAGTWLNRFSAGVLGGLMALALVGSAFAAGPAEGGGLLVRSNEPQNPATSQQNRPAVGPSVLAIPNLQAEYVSVQFSGPDAVFTFKLTNVGTKNATNVKVKQGAVWGTKFYAMSTLFSNSAYASLAPGQSVTVNVPCDAPASRYCLSAWIEVSSDPADANPNNNHAESPIYWP